MAKNFTLQMEQLAQLSNFYANNLKKFLETASFYAGLLDYLRHIDDELKNTYDLTRCLSVYGQFLEQYDRYSFMFDKFATATRSYVEAVNQSIADFRMG